MDYSFDVLIHRSVMWAYITSFSVVILLTVSFHVHMYLYSRYTFPVHVCLICMPLGLISYTRWVASDNPKFLYSDPRVWTIVALL